MSLIKTISLGIGKLAVSALLLGAFLVGMITVVWLSLRGETLQVPDIIGKNKSDAEKELVAIGLKIKKRADRYSEEKPDTILEQLPKSGETVKTGQVITVVVAQENPEGTEAPAVAKTPEEDKEDENESSVSPELRRQDKVKQKTKNANTSANTAKKDSLSNTLNPDKNKVKKLNSNNSMTGETSTGNSNKSDSGTTNKPANTATSSPKPTPAATPKTATSGDTRDRKIP